MNERSDMNRILRDWLDAEPSVMPDRVVDVVADRIAQQPQRRAWLPYRRPLPMNSLARLAAALAAVLIIAVVGWNLLPGNRSAIGGPGPTPSPSPTFSPSPVGPSPTAIACESNLPGCAGLLSAGLHHSNKLEPALSFNLASAWINTLDTPTIYELVPAYPFPPETQIFVWTNAVLGKQTPACDSIALGAVGNGVGDWMSYLRAHPGLTSSVPTAVTLGSVSGQVIDLSMKPSWKETCSGLDLGPVVEFILDTDPVAGTPLYGVSGRANVHLLVLDAGGRTIVVQVYVPTSTSRLHSIMADLQSLLDSLRFGTG